MKNNDSWVYYNGELYHDGVKGMQWGKHLPGTDWWKTFPGRQRISKGGDQLQNKIAKSPIANNRRRASKVGEPLINKLRKSPIVNNRRKVSKSGNQLTDKLKKSPMTNNSYRGTTAKGSILDIFKKPEKKESKLTTKDLYKDLRVRDPSIFGDYNWGREIGSKIRKYFQNSFDRWGDQPITSRKGSDGTNYLSPYVTRTAAEALQSYTNAVTSGKLGDYINSFITTAKMNVSVGCSKFLDSIGMDDEVYKFMKKIGIKDNNDIILEGIVDGLYKFFVGG